MYEHCFVCFIKSPLGFFSDVLFPAGNEEKAAEYEKAFSARIKAVESLLWDAERGAWFDFSLLNETRHLSFYPSNLAPLWAQCYSKPEMAEQAVKYLRVSPSHYKPFCQLLTLQSG